MAKTKVVQLKKEVPTTWQEALEEFIWWKQAGGLSQRTLEDYQGFISRFFKHHPEAYEPNKLKRAILEYMAEPAKPAYFNLKLIYLRAFINWCVNEGIYSSNPLIGIKKKKAEDKIVQINEETLKELLELPDKRTYAGLRDYALILLTLDTGIRPTEALSLRPVDINLSSLEVHVDADFAKTRVSRNLPISIVTAKAIKELLNVRHPDWKRDVPVFCTVEGLPYKRKSWGGRLKAYGERIGVDITPYKLRHAFALEYLRNGGNAFALQRTMGHTDLSMTKRYIALTQGDTKEQHLIASPINKLLPEKKRVTNHLK